jgi:hypothetical protein
MVGTKTYLNIATLPELPEEMAALRYAGIGALKLFGTLSRCV